MNTALALFGLVGAFVACALVSGIIVWLLKYVVLSLLVFAEQKSRKKNDTTGDCHNQTKSTYNISQCVIGVKGHLQLLKQRSQNISFFKTVEKRARNCSDKCTRDGSPEVVTDSVNNTLHGSECSMGENDSQPKANRIGKTSGYQRRIIVRTGEVWQGHNMPANLEIYCRQDRFRDSWPSPHRV